MIVTKIPEPIIPNNQSSLLNEKNFKSFISIPPSIEYPHYFSIHRKIYIGYRIHKAQIPIFSNG